MRTTLVQQNAIDAIQNAIASGSNLVVSSTAGSGKTYVIEALSYALDYSHDTIALAYNKNAQLELSERVADTIKTYTLHAYGYRMLAQNSNAKLQVKSGCHYFYALDVSGFNETNDKTEKAIAKFIASRSAQLHDKIKETLTDTSDIESVSALIERFDIKTSKYSENHVSRIIEVACHLVDSTKSRFEHSNVLDFIDMLWLPVQNGLMSRRDIVLVDEAQDLTPVKLALVQNCITPKSLILIGDSNQAINLWLGAIPNLLDDIGYKTVRLSETHRNGFNGCDFVQSRFNVEHLPADHVERDDLVTNVNTIDAAIALVESGLILSRTNADLVSVWFNLVANGKTAIVQGDDSLPKSLINALNDYGNIDALVESGDLSEDIAKTAKTLVKMSGSVQRAISNVSTMCGIQLCDKCNSPMVERQSKNGYKFYGCSTFPKCKNTKKYSANGSNASYVLSTVHKQKGSTFDHVILLPNLDGTGESLEERNIRFVACTRQTKSLILVTTAE